MASLHGRILKLMSGKTDSCSASSLSIILRRFSSTREQTTGFDFNDEEKDAVKSSHENSPHRVRGERPFFNPQFQSHSASTRRGPNRARHQPSPTSHNLDVPKNVNREVTLRDFNVSGNGERRLSDSFLDKFKLGVNDNKVKENPQASNPTTSRTSTANTVNVEQANINSDRASPPQDADEIFKKMKETGLIPNAVAMLDGLCKDGLVQEAMKLFGLMREKGTIPEVVIYTAVVDGFCKAHKLDDAKRIFRKMQNNGITPNAFSYTVLIQGLYKCNIFDDAIDFFLEMLEAGHSPNVTTFVGLVDGLCREKGVEEAQSVITTLRQKGFFLNDKAVREFLDKNAPCSSAVWEAIFGKKPSQKLF